MSRGALQGSSSAPGQSAAGADARLAFGSSTSTVAWLTQVPKLRGGAALLARGLVSPPERGPPDPWLRGERQVARVGVVVAAAARKGAAVALADLPGTGETGAKLEIGLARVSGILLGQHRARSHQAHVAAQHVPDLRQLVERRLAKDAS